ncbi:MAG: response regulator [Oligoflexus sp.]|nr:response regulator [Oligoflexus sp.]
MDFVDICRAFADESPQPTLAIDGFDHTVRYINSAGSELLCDGGSYSIGSHINILLPNEAGISDQILQNIIASGKSRSFVEQEISEGVVRFWSYFCWPVVSSSKEILGLILQIVDSSETASFRKRATDINQSLLLNSLHQLELRETAEKLADELNRATQAKSQFLAAMSHEIRTPLNAIVGFSELLQLPNQTDIERTTYGARIKRHSSLLLRLIDDILDLSKVEAGQLDVEKIEINLSDLLSDVAMVMQHNAEVKDLKFSMVLDPGLPIFLVSDPTRLKQILTNIIGNAVKFTTAGSVTVEVIEDQSQGKIRFLVKDTGVGLSTVQMNRLFKPFTQADSATTRKYGGTGLGLDLSRRLAQALGGDVIIAKSIFGVGSIFEVSIALEQAKYGVHRLDSLQPKAVAMSSLEGLRILVADDAPDNRFLISRFLTWSGARVDFAHDGSEAIEMAMRGKYDIILMDIQMPNVDGFTATSTLRKLGCVLPIIAMTAHAMRSDIEKCLRVGCDEHLAKPFGRIEIVEKIRQLLQGKLNWPGQHLELD